MSVPVQDIMGGGGKKHRKQAKHHNGGFGLTGAVSAGLLLAAEELYRNSLKKGAKSTKGHTVGGNDGPNMNLHDSRMGSLLDEAFGKPLTAGGKRRYRKHRGGDEPDEPDEPATAEAAQPEDSELVSLRKKNAELEATIEKLKAGQSTDENAAGEEEANVGGRRRKGAMKGKKHMAMAWGGDDADEEEGPSGGRRRKGAMKGKKHMAMAWGGDGDGAAPATPFNMAEIAEEARKTAEQSVGGRRRRHHATHYRGGDSAAFAKFSDAMNNQMPPPANTSPMAHGPVPMGIESSGMGSAGSPGSPLAGGRRRRATKKHGGSTCSTGGDGDMDGGRRRRRATKKHGGNDGASAVDASHDAMKSQVTGMSGMIGGLLNKLY